MIIGQAPSVWPAGAAPASSTEQSERANGRVGCPASGNGNRGPKRCVGATQLRAICVARLEAPADVPQEEAGPGTLNRCPREIDPRHAHADTYHELGVRRAAVDSQARGPAA